MRQVKTALALMITMTVFLTSCSGRGAKAEKIAAEIRSELISAPSVVTVVNVKADYGERVYEYKLRYSGNLSEGVVEVIEPEAIAGVTADVSVSGCVLKYDGAEVDTGDVISDGTTPIGVIPVLLYQWRSGHIKESTFETLGDAAAVAVSSDVSETVVQRTWFDRETHMPIKAEIYENGYTALSCGFEDVIFG